MAILSFLCATRHLFSHSDFSKLTTLTSSYVVLFSAIQSDANEEPASNHPHPSIESLDQVTSSASAPQSSTCSTGSCDDLSLDSLADHRQNPPTNGGLPPRVDGPTSDEMDPEKQASKAIQVDLAPTASSAASSAADSGSAADAATTSTYSSSSSAASEAIRPKLYRLGRKFKEVPLFFAFGRRQICIRLL